MKLYQNNQHKYLRIIIIDIIKILKSRLHALKKKKKITQSRTFNHTLTISINQDKQIKIC